MRVTKQETLEEAGERLYPNRESFLYRFQNIERKAFTAGAKWQQENWNKMITAEICKEHINGFKEGVKYQQDKKMFSEEEVRQMLWDLGDVLFNNNQNGIKEGDPEKYIEEIIGEFKNK